MSNVSRMSVRTRGNFQPVDDLDTYYGTAKSLAQDDNPWNLEFMWYGFWGPVIREKLMKQLHAERKLDEHRLQLFPQNNIDATEEDLKRFIEEQYEYASSLSGTSGPPSNANNPVNDGQVERGPRPRRRAVAQPRSAQEQAPPPLDSGSVIASEHTSSDNSSNEKTREKKKGSGARRISKYPDFCLHFSRMVELQKSHPDYARLGKAKTKDRRIGVLFEIKRHVDGWEDRPDPSVPGPGIGQAEKSLLRQAILYFISSRVDYIFAVAAVGAYWGFTKMKLLEVIRCREAMTMFPDISPYLPNDKMPAQYKFKYLVGFHEAHNKESDADWARCRRILQSEYTEFFRSPGAETTQGQDLTVDGLSL
ncbi:hypothetical protein BC834DRAFT_969072 [Gloeopeniophorella convolvens]|nr:hypothetical protein BC834DRAFT_969072 [Gloeopeniophorella convolvens]